MRIDGCVERSASCGQWQFDGSGQQHCSTSVNVRNCEVGTASATTIATTMVDAADAILRILTSPFAQTTLQLSIQLSSLR